MARLQPFRGWRYGADGNGPLQELITPPYDVISPTRRQEMAARNPYSFVHLVLPEATGSDDRYQVARRTFRQWRQEGVLVRDAEPCFTLHRQTYSVAGASCTRTGLLGLLPLNDGGGDVRPHENTLLGPRQDRQKLFVAMRAHPSPVFVLAPDADGALGRVLDQGWNEETAVSFTDDDGIAHRFQAVSTASFCRQVQEILATQPLLIADGHHRFESAIACQKELASIPGTPDSVLQEAGRLPVHVVSMTSPGLTILPIHRTVKGLPGFAAGRLKDSLSDCLIETVSAADGEATALTSRLAAAGRGALGVLLAGEPAGLIYRLPDPGNDDLLSRLDVTRLHTLILRDQLGIDADTVEKGDVVGFVKDPQQALEAVLSGQVQAAFLLNATPLDDLEQVTAAGLKMPQKSTFFYPKVPAGLVIHTFD